MKRFIGFFFLTIFLFMFISETAMAIPAFARKYRMSCQTCHAPIPKLKPYGDEFAGNGFQLSDQEARGYYVETGDENLSLLREFPLALRLEGFITYNFGDSERSDFGLPYLMKLLSGGSISDDIAYYFYFYLNERGEVAGVEDAYIMFNNLLGGDFDIYLGQFQVSDPLFKRELRLTLEDYQIYKLSTPYSRANLAYDRGLMLTLGLESGTSFVLEIINGNGIGEANNLHIFDEDDNKNFALRVSQDVGENLRIGAFGYLGMDNIQDGNELTENDLTYYGPDATLFLGDKLELNLQYLWRKDDYTISRGSTLVLDSQTETSGGLAELIYTPDGDASDWYAVGLLNFANSDLDRLDYKTVTGHLGYLLRRNLRLVGEATYNFTDEENKFMQFSVGFVSGF